MQSERASVVGYQREGLRIERGRGSLRQTVAARRSRIERKRLMMREGLRVRVRVRERERERERAETERGGTDRERERG
jgi:hypothetical protein